MAPSSLYAVYYPAREAAGRPDLRTHDLRHTGAVLAAATGATLAELMARLGHSTVSVLLRHRGGVARMCAGCLPDAGCFSGTSSPWASLAPGPDRKGHVLLLRARRSEFWFPTEAPGHPAIWSAAGDGGEPY